MGGDTTKGDAYSRDIRARFPEKGVVEISPWKGSSRKRIPNGEKRIEETVDFQKRRGGRRLRNQRVRKKWTNRGRERVRSPECISSLALKLS